MSRTYRRNKSELIKMHVGSLDEYLRDEGRSSWKWKYKTLTLEQEYERRVARFTGDNHKGIYSVPSWYTRLKCTLPMRRYERREIHRCIRQDDWDGHLPTYRGLHHRYWW